jgi:hypothetical protein
MTKTNETDNARFDAAEVHIAELKKQVAELTGNVNNLFKLLGPVFDRFAVVDTQQLMINARAPERQANPAKAGSATPYDAQVDRIGARRRELLGGK